MVGNTNWRLLPELPRNYSKGITLYFFVALKIGMSVWHLLFHSPFSNYWYSQMHHDPPYTHSAETPLWIFDRLFHSLLAQPYSLAVTAVQGSLHGLWNRVEIMLCILFIILCRWGVPQFMSGSSNHTGCNTSQLEAILIMVVSPIAIMVRLCNSLGHLELQVAITVNQIC